MLRLFCDASKGLLLSSFVCSSSSCAALAVLRVSAKNDDPLKGFLFFSDVRLCARGAKTRQARRRQHVQKVTRPRLQKSVFSSIFGPPAGLRHKFRQDVLKSLPKAAPEGVLAPPPRAKTYPGAAQDRPGSPPGAAQERPGSVSRGHLSPKRAPRAFQSLLKAAREGISAPFRPHWSHFLE